MNKLVSYLLIFISPFFLSGCNFIDEYYIYEVNYLSKLELKLSPLKDELLKEELNQVFKSIQIRIKLNSSKSSLLVIQSYDVSKISEDTKKRFNKKNVLFESESKTFDSCKYVNENNWICKSHNGFGSGYEMKNGDLFRDGDKLNKQYSIKF
jgi:hypothetical protein